jgi:hypothetical protein
MLDQLDTLAGNSGLFPPTLFKRIGSRSGRGQPPPAALMSRAYSAGSACSSPRSTGTSRPFRLDVPRRLDRLPPPCVPESARPHAGFTPEPANRPRRPENRMMIIAPVSVAFEAARLSPVPEAWRWRAAACSRRQRSPRTVVGTVDSPASTVPTPILFGNAAHRLPTHGIWLRRAAARSRRPHCESGVRTVYAPKTTVPTSSVAGDSSRRSPTHRTWPSSAAPDSQLSHRENGVGTVDSPEATVPTPIPLGELPRHSPPHKVWRPRNVARSWASHCQNSVRTFDAPVSNDPIPKPPRNTMAERNSFRLGGSR